MTVTDKEELDRKVHSRRPFAVGAVALVFALIALGFGISAVLIESQHQNERLAEASAANVEHDYQNCLVGNDSRAKLRKLEDRIANPNPYDVNAIIKDEDAPRFAAQLRTLLLAQQASAQQFRQDNANDFAPRDCDAERKVQEARAGG